MFNFTVLEGQMSRHSRDPSLVTSVGGKSSMLRNYEGSSPNVITLSTTFWLSSFSETECFVLQNDTSPFDFTRAELREIFEPRLN